MEGKYDVIIVGARCGGAPTAMLLARRGYRVLLVDSARFPSDIPHGHFIHRGGPKQLSDWGLLDPLIATGCPACTTFKLDVDGRRLLARNVIVNGVAAGYGPRRFVFDELLVDAAVKAGAEFREGFVVDDYVGCSGKITGIRGRHRSGGAAVRERATLTVGADGRNSKLARTVEAMKYNVVPTLTCWIMSYWHGVSAAGLEIYQRGRIVVFAFPTHGDLFAVFVAWPIDRYRDVQSDIEREFLAAVRQVPELADRLQAARRAERFRGAADLPNFMRKPHGPGWALVGDAGCHKDPYLALGICDALRDSDFLARAIDRGLGGAQPLHEALGDYERQRNEASGRDYQMNIEMARFTPPSPDEIALQHGLARDPVAARQFFLARERLIPMEAFFNAENLQRIRAGGSAE